jgi:cephalosporin hydroxylase
MAVHDDVEPEAGLLTRGVISVDLGTGRVTLSDGGRETSHELSSPEGFDMVSRAWLRAGWDAKYVYGFSWLGRPIIQLPEDMVRAQELIYSVRPDMIIETGIAHGGSLIFYAGLLRLMGGGRVIGIDIDIRPHNRKAIEDHELFDQITLVEGSSIDPSIIARVAELANGASRTMLVLDSNHTRDHVLAELTAYAPLVTQGSYIIVADGIMQPLAGAPRSEPDWAINNPLAAVGQFLAENRDFERYDPGFPFNEGAVQERVTYWPQCHLRRRA